MKYISRLITVKRSFSLDVSTYHRLADHALDCLHDSVEKILEGHDNAHAFDASLSMGVLTIKLDQLGTFVINKQPPNLQLWLSSPISGPKRFDYEKGNWVYKRDHSSLPGLLSREFSLLFKKDIEISIPPPK